MPPTTSDTRTNNKTRNEPAPTTVFRVVGNRPSRLQDFMSEHSVGRPPLRSDAQARELQDGVSVWETKEQAALHARVFSPQTVFLVTLDRFGHPLQSKRTTSAAGHRTVTAEPIEIYSRSILGEHVPPSAAGGGERHWELWSNATRNMVGCFPSEMKAPIALGDAGRQNGNDYLRSLTLAMVGGSEVDAITGQQLLRHLKKPRD